MWQYDRKEDVHGGQYKEEKQKRVDYVESDGIGDGDIRAKPAR